MSSCLLRTRSLAALAAFAVVVAQPAAAGSPFLEPGDTALRSDIQRLADAGVIQAVASTWPMSWPHVARDVNSSTVDPERLDAGTRRALERVRQQARRTQQQGLQLSFSVAGAANATELRTFEDTTRENGELGATAEWLGERFAFNATGTIVVDPDDGREVRPDGSYVGVTLGNWMFSAGYLDRWWGPGWEGSNVLGNNARPFAAFAIDRKFQAPFETRGLRWIGPWSASLFAGQLENDREDIDRPLFLGLRLTAKPFDAVEIGLVRTAQACGEGRPCNTEVWKNLVLGDDNAGETVDPLAEPGNQMAGYDLRWASPFDLGPWAVYGQEIGEDESSKRPIFKLRLFGAEWWGDWGEDARFRAHVEYAKTACGANLGCSYKGGPYQVEGYSYRGRSLGHAMYRDGESVSLGLTLSLDNDVEWNALLRHADLNPIGDRTLQYHTVIDVPEERWNIELGVQRPALGGWVKAGIGADSGDRRGSSYVAGRAWLRWESRR